ncbi:MAG: hypothetical protein VXW22_07595 [Pseudomonadota bacterium]|nr:hypothetical protein [Pseudomonadota bacterium]
MTLNDLTQFLAWFTVLNYALMLVSWLIFIAIKDTAMNLHSSTMGVAKEELPRLYFQYFSIYKVLILTFGLVPYLVLRFIMGTG